MDAARAYFLTRGRDPVWADKMLHPVPADLPTVADRAAYLVAKATNRHVLDLGCTGPISARIAAVATSYHGVDRQPPYVVVDLDTAPETLPAWPGVNLIVMSELLEHLMNPGRFLQALAGVYPACPYVVTVPNAGSYQQTDGCEVVNRDHVAWYSYTTIHALLARVSYAVEDVRWYHGQAHTAEGLIVLGRTAGG